MTDVVGAAPFEVPAAREPEDPAMIPRGALILERALEADAWIALRILDDDVGRFVAGRVVRDDQLEVGERLRLDRIETGTQVALPIEDGQSDRHRVHGSSRALCAWKASAYPSGAPASMPRSRSRLSNVSPVNQRLLRCVANAVSRWRTLARPALRDSGT